MPKYIYNHLTEELPSGGGISPEEVKKMINEALKDYVKTTTLNTELSKYQVKLTLVKNEASGDTNADLDESGNLRIWDAEFEGNKLVKSFRIIDSSVAGVSDLDTDLTTAKYENKFFTPKS